MYCTLYREKCGPLLEAERGKISYNEGGENIREGKRKMGEKTKEKYSEKESNLVNYWQEEKPKANKANEE